MVAEDPTEIGLADFTTERLFEEIDYEALNQNVFTSTFIEEATEMEFDEAGYFVGFEEDADRIVRALILRRGLVRDANLRKGFYNRTNILRTKNHILACRPKARAETVCSIGIVLR